MAIWQLLRQHLDIRESQEVTYVTPPTDQVLDRFEAKNKVKLPKSFRQYSKLFGAGELAGYYRIATPLVESSDYELGEFNKQAHGDPEDRIWESYGSAETVGKLFFFCSTIGGEYYVWKIDEITKKSANEYAIYHLARSVKLKRVADTFEEFIFDICLRQKLTKDGWWPERKYSRFDI